MGFWSEFKKRMTSASPWISAILNFFAWGLGYLYARRKKLLGLALTSFIVANLTASGAIATGGMSVESMVAVVGATYLFASLALARDAYVEAKAKNREAKTE